MFGYTFPAQEPGAPRYPSQCDTDEYFASDIEEETESSAREEEDVNMEVDGVTN